jgi:hypothetical protein
MLNRKICGGVPAARNRRRRLAALRDSDYHPLRLVLSSGWIKQNSLRNCCFLISAQLPVLLTTLGVTRSSESHSHSGIRALDCSCDTRKGRRRLCRHRSNGRCGWQVFRPVFHCINRAINAVPGYAGGEPSTARYGGGRAITAKFAPCRSIAQQHRTPG